MIRTTGRLIGIVLATLILTAPLVTGQNDPTNLGFIGGHKTQTEKTDPCRLPFMGAWRINLTKSDPGIQPRFTPTAINLFICENGGIRQETFQDYPPKVDTFKTAFDQRYRSFWFRLDGQSIYKDPHGPNGEGETVAMWLVDRNTLYREVATKGVVGEKVLYRVSPDGKTLVWTSFGNVKGNSGLAVWDRAEMPAQRTN